MHPKMFVAALAASALADLDGLGHSGSANVRRPGVKPPPAKAKPYKGSKAAKKASRRPK